ncbi:MAG: hypothetical protein HYT87_13885 [Nitrospirae bacterium]|nr:hypothetical protein [Nitrospirota bacterium]
MGKPIREVVISTPDRKKRSVPALFDSGAFHTILRSDCLPSPEALIRYRPARKLGTARKGARVTILGTTYLVIQIGDKMIETSALVSPDLSREMVIGAEAMQAWDISIRNSNGKRSIFVRHDMRDPDITEVA